MVSYRCIWLSPPAAPWQVSVAVLTSSNLHKKEKKISISTELFSLIERLLTEICVKLPVLFPKRVCLSLCRDDEASLFPD